jgi:hypothetical protein
MMAALELDGACREVVARGPWQLSDTPAAERLVKLLPFDGRVGAPYWMESEMWEAAGVELDQLRTYADALAALIPAFGR